MLQKGGGEHAFPKFCFCQPFKNCNNVKFPVELKCSSLCFSEHVARGFWIGVFLIVRMLLVFGGFFVGFCDFFVFFFFCMNHLLPSHV